MRNEIARGSVPGFSYLVRTGIRARCFLCARKNDDGSQPLLVGTSDEPSDTSTSAICESCSVLATWIWTSTRDASLPVSAFPLDVAESLVIVLRERPQDYAIPYDVMVVHRNDSSRSTTLPGGKLCPGEDSETAVVRWLRDETGLMTWKSALEPVYLGYGPRGRLVRTYLCRAYFGVDKPLTDAAWKPWNGKQKYAAGHFAGYYLGLFEAVKARIALQRASASLMPLSTCLSAAASHYLSLSLLKLAGRASEADLSMMSGFGYSIQSDEREVLGLVISTEEKKLDLQVRGMPLPGDEKKPSRRTKEKSKDEDEDVEDGDGEDGEDGENGEDERDAEGDASSEFVRPAPPSIPE